MESKKKRAKPAAGPLRLAWPGGGTTSIGRQATLVSSSQASSEGRGKRKRKTQDTTLWVDKYAPTRVQNLCVAPKKIKEIRAWLTAEQSSSSRLLVFVGGPGIGKSTAIKVLASELGWTVHEWSDSCTSQHYTGGSNQDMSVDRSNPIESFQDFLDRSGAGFSPLQLSLGLDETEPTNKSDEGKAVIVIDEIPNLRNAEVEEEFRDIMSRHLERTNVPTVLIFSDVREGKHQPRDLERLVDPQYLYNPEMVTILQCNPVTKARMKKSLEAISKKEGIKVPAHFWEEVHLQSGGDLRHAIMSLQFRGDDNDVERNDGKKHYERDARLSMFHTLGKVLYAKRKKESTDSESSERPPLDFNPDIVMEQSGMDLGGAVTFLGYHSPDFFTDVSELSRAFDRYSDASVLLGHSMQRDYNDSIFPAGYVGSIAGRAVADANRHPAPNSFRSLLTPKIFEVMRNKRANEVTMEQLCKRLSVSSERMPLDTNIGKCRTFVTDRLPFMRTIVPGDVDYAMNNLYSCVRSNERKEVKMESENAIRLEEQAKILEMDDIVEEDDSSSEDDFDDDTLHQNEPDAKRMKPTALGRKDPRKVSLSPQEVISIDA